MHVRDNVILLSSTTTDAFGTGYIAYQDDTYSYIVTNRHVLDAIGGLDSLSISSLSIIDLYQDTDDTVDIAIIRARGAVSRPSPVFGTPKNLSGTPVSVFGFDKTPDGYMLLESTGHIEELHFHELAGTRVEYITIIPNSRIAIENGFSGGPVVHCESGIILGTTVLVERRLSLPNIGIAIATSGFLKHINPPLSSILPTNADPFICRANWGYAPKNNQFFGRDLEVADLRRIFAGNDVRVMLISGLKGVGKSDLSITFGEEIANNFEFLVWRTLVNLPDSKELLLSILQDIYPHGSGVSQLDTFDDILRAFHIAISQHRCLIYLDNLETFIDTNADLPSDLSTLVELLCTSDHSSCFLLTSREVPRLLNLHSNNKPFVFVYQLTGLSDHLAAAFFARVCEIDIDQEIAKRISSQLAGNPLALQLAGLHIKHVYSGRAELFLESKQLDYLEIDELLAWHFDRLSRSETNILRWLAICRVPVTVPFIRDATIDETLRAATASALQSLKLKLPISASDKGHSLQPVILEHATKDFVRKLVEELRSARLDLFSNFPVVLATAETHVRLAQERAVLDPVARRIREDVPIKTLLQSLRAVGGSGYAAGNLLNIVRITDNAVSDYNFSSLHIRQAFLQDVPVRNVDFTDVTFRECLFTESFGKILCVATIAEHRTIAVGDALGNIYVWNIRTKQLVAKYRAHDSWVRSLAFSPQNSLLASGSSDYTVKIWDANSWTAIKTMQDHTEQVYGVAFSTDESVLGSVSEDKSAIFYNVSSCYQVHKSIIGRGRIRTIDFLVNQALVGCDDLLLSDDSLENYQVLSNHIDCRYFRCSCVSPDLQLIAACTDSGDLFIWAAPFAKGYLACSLAQRVHTVTFSWEGNILLIGGNSGELFCWDIPSSSFSRTISCHDAAIRDIGVLDSATIVTVSDDQTIKVWDITTGNCLHSISGYSNAIRSLCQIDETIVAGTERGEILGWTNNYESHHTIGSDSLTVQSVSASPCAKYLVAGSDSGNVCVWSTSDFRLKFESKFHDDWIWCVRFSNDSNWVATASRDRTLLVRALWREESPVRLFGHHDEVHTLAFHPTTPGILVSGGDDHLIKVWNYLQGTEFATFYRHEDCVRSVAFDESGSRLFSGGDDCTIYVWDFQSGECIDSLHGHVNRVRQLVIVGNKLASIGDEGILYLWDPSNENTPVLSTRAHTEPSWTLSYSFNEDVLCTGGEDGTIKFWCGTTLEHLRTLRPTRPYEDSRFSNAKGLSTAQTDSLKSLGAVI